MYNRDHESHNFKVLSFCPLSGGRLKQFSYSYSLDLSVFLLPQIKTLATFCLKEKGSPSHVIYFIAPQT